MKPYKTGLLVGRFQMIHCGHITVFDKALELCDRVCIFIGSSQESRTEKNPFTYEEREAMFRILYGEKISLAPLPDAGLGNNSLWGKYVLEQAEKEFGVLPDLVISGKESRRTSWLDCLEGEGIAELFVPKTVEISATEMREYLKNSEREKWESVSPAPFHGMYGELREKVLMSVSNKTTDSI